MLKPSGGVKILFEIADALNKSGHPACILIPGKRLYPKDCPPNWKPHWFETDVRVVDDVDVVTKDDIVLIHEEGIWCFNELVKSGCKYIMINQGAQMSIANNVGKYISYEEAKNIYQGAIGAIVVSEYIKEAVKLIFNVNYPIFSVNNVVDDFFVPGKKENLILVMDKNSTSPANSMMQKILVQRYPGWKLALVKDMTIQQVADHMRRAKIFVFLCSPSGEGSSIPPVEAALCGCKVIGQSGMGSREYYKFPIFSEFDVNDVLEFTRLMDSYTNMLHNRTLEELIAISVEQREKLRNSRTKDNFIKQIKFAIEELLNGKVHKY